MTDLAHAVAFFEAVGLKVLRLPCRPKPTPFTLVSTHSPLWVPLAQSTAVAEIFPSLVHSRLISFSVKLLAFRPCPTDPKKLVDYVVDIALSHGGVYISAAAVP